MTGAASGLGRVLVERLSTRTDLGALFGVDASPALVDGVVWRTTDLRDPALADRLHGVTVVVHLGLVQHTGAGQLVDVVGTRHVLSTARALGARVVLCTTAEVYGSHADNPVPIADSHPLRAQPEAGSRLAEQLQVEDLVAEHRRTGGEVTVLRPASLVGLSHAYDGQLVRQLGAQRLLAVKGVEPLWQLCHVDDLVSAIELAVVGSVGGTLGVGCDGAMPQVVVERLAGRRRLELPESVVLSTAERLHRLGITTASVADLDHVRGTLVLASDGLRAAGWTPTWSNELALKAHLAGRGSDSRAAAYTAAGATVALLGTAALVRRRRRRG